MEQFIAELHQAQPQAAGAARRTWYLVPYDQLTHGEAPWARRDPAHIGLIVFEPRYQLRRRPYHRQKIALLLSNLRHFALEAALRGFAVRYVAPPTDPSAQVIALARELGPLTLMEPAERELRHDLAEAVAAGALVIVPHEGWLTTTAEFERWMPTAPWRMDRFYRAARRSTGLLMSGDKPLGGRFSFDGDNRKPWRGEPVPPSPPQFAVDAIAAEVGTEVATHFTTYPGRVDLEAIPHHEADAMRYWSWVKASVLEWFGPFEDAMSMREPRLFHTGLSALLNIGRLSARELLNEAVALPIPLNSKEGFVRQILGWREFVRHVHRATDGFRRLTDVRSRPAAASFDLPSAYWGTKSDLMCLDSVVHEVWETGYSHHITRLMVLSNIATLLEVNPIALSDWFWVAYTDAYDWVVEPNVLAMGTYAVGDLMTTKPYVAGSAYLKRMSDYCAACAFDPQSTCPLTRAYWAYLARHETELHNNLRVALPLRQLGKRSADERNLDARTVDRLRDALGRGDRVPVDVIAQAARSR